jgi:hypothetical protein
MNNHHSMGKYKNICNNVYLAPLSKKSFASLIFAAMYGEPPERSLKKLKILYTEMFYLDRDD